MLARAVAIGRAREQELVAVRALMLCHAVIAAGLHESTHLVQLLELANRALHRARVDAGVLRELLDGRPCSPVAVVVGDPDQHELRRAGGARVVQGDRH